MSIYRKSATLGQNYFFCEEQTLYGSARLGTEAVEHSMRGLVTNDGLTDKITREQHGDNWQQRLDEQYDGRFYERLQEAWGNEWSTRLDFVLQGNNDGWLIEQIRNESYTLQVGNKRYELSNHLGNVLAVVSDKKAQTDGAAWSAIVVSAQDYFPFGMTMPGRSTTSTYKYGFNGQEKDTEMGAGIYTAEFWEYDARLGRRMNLDPIKKQWQSDYACLSNAPMWKIDPNGDDDYFNSSGQFLYSQGKTSNIYVVLDEKKVQESKILLTKIPLTVDVNRQIVVNVIGYYACEVGINYEGFGGNRGKGAIGIAKYPKDPKKTNNRPLAFTNKDNIWVNYEGDKIDELLADANNLKSTLEHEKDHKSKGDGYGEEKNDFYNHVFVYITQVSSENFLKTTAPFKVGIIGSMAKHIEKAANEQNYQRSDIEGLIATANKALSKTGYHLEADFGFSSTTMKINVVQDKKK